MKYWEWFVDKWWCDNRVCDYFRNSNQSDVHQHSSYKFCNSCGYNWSTGGKSSNIILNCPSILWALQKVAEDVKLALEVVSYIGCAVSIICLIATVIFFLLQGYVPNPIWIYCRYFYVLYRKKLLAKGHNFVHLNLALSLLLANIVFVSGVETATANEVN